MPYPGMKPLFSPAVVKALPAPSALHMRVVLPISTSAGIACPFLEKKRLTATGGVTQTFPDMEEHSGKKSGRRAIIWLYNNKVVIFAKK